MSYVIQRMPVEGVWDDLSNLYQKVTGGISQVSDLANKASGYLDVAQHVLEDPYFPQTVALVRQLRSQEEAHPSAGGPPGPQVKGVGLKVAVKPLQAFVYARKHSWVAPAAIAGVLLVPFILGYAIGRK